MKQYPSFDGKIIGIPITAFDKLDGSNIRCEVDRKKGMFKFGSRKVLLGEDHPYLGKAEGIIRAKYEEFLTRLCRDERWEMATPFFEFHGAKSFAGLHDPTDPTLTATLIDIDIYKRGMPVPRDFLKLFEGKVDIPRVVYQGNPTADFIQAVREGTLEGVTYEGVVCKGAPLKKGLQPTMFKVKSAAWIQAVKARYADDPKMLADLL